VLKTAALLFSKVQFGKSMRDELRIDIGVLSLDCLLFSHRFRLPATGGKKCV
jgi:hypothetical protein